MTTFGPSDKRMTFLSFIIQSNTHIIQFTGHGNNVEKLYKN